MGIQAREIVRYAKKNSIELQRGVYDFGGSIMCAGSVVCRMGKADHDNQGDLFNGIEAGFEGWKLENYKNPSPAFIRYYKVGANVARMTNPRHYWEH